MYTLLIVDDEATIIDGISRLLDWKQLGFERICAARNGTEMIENMLKWEPDICLVDVRLRDVYGYEVINKLNEIGMKCNYIMMSGYDDFSYACEALRCGAQDYLLKPINREQLKKRIEKVIVEKLHGTLPEEEKEKEDPVLLRAFAEFSPLIQKMLMIVSVEYGKHISLKDIADRFRMNPVYLGQLFIKETGMKFAEYLMSYRMTIAKKRILYTDEKIVNIASEVGYSNMNYFYNHFHKYYNITPSEMRKDKN